MANTFDIFNPQETKVIKGLKGKIITLYGISGTGKTKQCAKLSKPLFLNFETGTNALGGLKMLTIEKWSDFIKYNNQLTSPATVDKARELYDTIILDSIDAMENIAVDFVCKREGVTSIGEIPHGKGYKLYENLFWNEINKLTLAGYCCVFIGHPKTDMNGFINVKGDQTRTVEPITSRSDIVAYIQPMGVDQDGKPIHSRAWFVQTEQFFARSRFETIVPVLEEFTAENLNKAIIDAIEAEEEDVGSANTATFDEFQQVNKIQRKSYEELQQEMRDLGNLLADKGYAEDRDLIVTKRCGEGVKASSLKRDQTDIMEALILDFQNFLDGLNDN